MTEIFKTVLTLSIIGFCLTGLLLILKPLTAQKIPARLQYIAWCAVMLAMIIPVYKLIPREEAQKLPQMFKSEQVLTNAREIEPTAAPAPVQAPLEKREISIAAGGSINLLRLAARIWLFGTAVYLIAVIGSYALYLMRKRKNSVEAEENAVFESVKKELKIKRNIRLRMSADFESPMLVGVLFPVIYIPLRKIPPENMRMIFLHELTHYRRKDLAVKWLSLLVNAVHWFNPLCYLLCANISEVCEISCDMCVTRNMPYDEQKTYMKTIVDLIE